MTEYEWPTSEPPGPGFALTDLHAGDISMPFVPPAPRLDLLWLAVDLDGTLAKPVWTPDNPVSVIGDPIWGNVFKLRRAVAKGYKVIIHTARPWTDFEAIEAWCAHWVIPQRRIVCGKILAAAYLDDRGVHESAVSWIPGEEHCATCRCKS